jgi:hypothetical protein
MLTTIRYIMLTASRDMLFIGVMLGMLLTTALSALLGSTAMLEGNAMTLSFAASSARITLVLGIAVFVCFHLRQSFENKEIDVLLSRPVSRPAIMLAYWLGFSLVASLLVVAAMLILSFLKGYQLEGFFLWSLTLLLEGWLLVALSLFAGFTLRSAVSSVLVTLGFYVLGRMMAFFLLTLDNPVAFIHIELSPWLKGLMAGLAMIIPRLDLFAQSEWLVYGIQHPQEIHLILWQVACFVPLLLLAAIIDFLRKEF